MLVYALLILGIACRLMVHVPNFTPVIAIALFSGLYVNRKWSVLVPVVLMAATDLILGLHDMVLFTWGSVALIAWVNAQWRDQKNPRRVLVSSVLSALFFFVVTNFGVWLVSGMYARTIEGFWQCYVMAVPFFRMTLLSTVVYAVVLCGGYELMAQVLRKMKLAYFL